MNDPQWGGILLFYTIILVGIALVSIHYRKKYEEMKRLIEPKGWQEFLKKR